MYDIVTDRKIKVAVVGCGRISKNHFDSIKENDEFELIAVCDNHKERLDDAISKYDVKGYSSLEDLLENESLDLVALCTPSGIHPEQAIMAAHYGVNVLTEKPMGVELEPAKKMIQACEEKKKRLFVVKQNRKNKTLQLLKRAIEENRFGKIHMVHLNVFWTRPQEYYDLADWRGTWKYDGGAFMNQASHYVDLLTWYFGSVDSVHAMTTTHRDIEAEDTGVLNIRWKSGVIGSMSVTMCTYPKNLEGSITILGEDGTARVGGLAVNEIQEWSFKEKKDYDETIHDATYSTTSVYGFGHPLYYENVANVFRGKEEPETDGHSGFKSLELILAAYKSAKTGTVVTLPLEE